MSFLILPLCLGVLMATTPISQSTQSIPSIPELIFSHLLKKTTHFFYEFLE